jgi:signal transduction histidine kinase
METFGQLKRLGCVLVLLWHFCNPVLRAQKGFDQKLDFEQIQALLKSGIKSRDPHQEALGWYLWGHYGETNVVTPENAFGYLEKSATLFRMTTDTLAYFRVRTEIGQWLAVRGFDNEAKGMYEEALQYWRRQGNLYFETFTLAQLYRLEPTQKYSNKTEKKPEEYLSAFEEKNEKLKDTVLKMSVLVKKAERLHKSRYYKAAAQTGEELLELASTQNNPFYTAHANYIIGLEALTDTRDYELAETYLKRAEAINPESAEGADLRRNIYQGLIQLYTATEKMKEGNEYALRYVALGDELLDRKRTAAVQRVSMQFSMSQKEEIISKLEMERKAADDLSRYRRNVMIALVFFTGLFIAFGAYYYYNMRRRLQNERIIAEQSEEINLRKIKDLEKTLLIGTMKGMIDGVESERNRVAKDLHDSVGGMLASIKIAVQGLASKYKSLAESNQFTYINKLLDDTAVETRNISHNLQPAALYQFGFEKAVQDLCGRFSGKADGPGVHFQSIGNFSKLDDTVALNAYRIIQELLQNSIKHAEATEIMVQITRTEQEMTLLVEDNGKGYDPVKVRKGMGTDNLSNRVKFLQGELSIHTSLGKGTSNMVSIPMA